MKTLMTIAVAALCSVALAQGPEGGSRPGGPRRGGMGMGPREGGMMMGGDPIVRMVMNPKMAESLGLSDAQKEKLKTLNRSPEENREAQTKVREATMKQIDLMKADKIDEAAVMAAIDEVFELRKAMAKEQAKRVIAVKSILTPEQIAKANAEMKKPFTERGDRGPRRGMGPREGRGPRDGMGPREGKGPREDGDKPAPKPEEPAPKPAAE